MNSFCSIFTLLLGFLFVCVLLLSNEVAPWGTIKTSHNVLKQQLKQPSVEERGRVIERKIRENDRKLDNKTEARINRE